MPEYICIYIYTYIHTDIYSYIHIIYIHICTHITHIFRYVG